QPLTSFASFTPGDFFGSGTSNFALDLNLFNGDALTVIFNDGIQNNVGLLVALATSEVPLPAAGGMLLTGLAAAGFVARRKKKTAT
ncbi:MAG: VPLPA-CTERM sorting domain-containing protein, partial [Pseudomonadota bacterium]